MAYTGRDVLEVGLSRKGEKYVFGAVVPLNNANWHGPWDCAEFASWATYQAYGLIFGAGNGKNPVKAEPYSGHWYSDAKAFGRVISWEDALQIPGAAVIRAPARGKIGHVAFALGDGDRTLEARGAAYGLDVFGDAGKRAWSIGCLLPGVDYGDNIPASTIAVGSKKQRVTKLPNGYLWMRTPRMKGANVAALQRALAKHSVDPGPIDGVFGEMTNAAVLSFQLREGIEVDGVVGPRTAKSLDLAFPIVAADGDVAITDVKRFLHSEPITIVATGDIDAVASIRLRGKSFVAKTTGGFEFVVGTSTPYTDDMQRVGLYQGKTAINDSLKFGTYDPSDFQGLGQWAHFIAPTLNAEGSARFGTINTYDRAAFTFGAPQLAAHTPGKNFIVYLRHLLSLQNADKHFPELSLRKNTKGEQTVHLIVDGESRDLEEAVVVTRPNGKKENQLQNLMKYLNPSPVKIDAAEVSAAARLLNWLRLDPKAKELQLVVFIDQAKEALSTAKRKVPAFDGKEWQIALWIMDILHQGRGTYAELNSALSSANRTAALQAIGAKRYKSRVTTVATEMKKLEKSGVLDGFQV